MADLDRLKRKYKARDRLSNWGYVYLIEGKPGEHKIGLTGHPRTRIQGIQKELGHEVTVLHVIPTKRKRQLEEQLLSRFADKHIGHEWFNLTQADIDYIKSLEGDVLR